VGNLHRTTPLAWKWGQPLEDLRIIDHGVLVKSLLFLLLLMLLLLLEFALMQPWKNDGHEHE
jgi:hypothetical protein